MSNVTQSAPSRQSQPAQPSPSRPASGEDNPMFALRKRRAVALVPTVRRVDGGFRVSSSCRDIRYLVTQPNGHLVCTCPDYQRHEQEPSFKCKHCWAVEMALEEERLAPSPNGHTPAEAEPPAQSLSVVHRSLLNDDPVRLKLIKNTKGYSWEISVAEHNPETALAMLQDLEERVKATFGDNNHLD